MSTANSAEAKKEFSKKYSGKLILNGFINKQEEARRDYEEKKGKYLRINETRSTNEFICVISRRRRARSQWTQATRKVIAAFHRQRERYSADLSLALITQNSRASEIVNVFIAQLPHSLETIINCTK